MTKAFESSVYVGNRHLSILPLRISSSSLFLLLLTMPILENQWKFWKYIKPNTSIRLWCSLSSDHRSFPGTKDRKQRHQPFHFQTKQSQKIVFWASDKLKIGRRTFFGFLPYVGSRPKLVPYSLPIESSRTSNLEEVKSGKIVFFVTFLFWYTFIDRRSLSFFILEVTYQWQVEKRVSIPTSFGDRKRLPLFCLNETIFCSSVAFLWMFSHELYFYIKG